jgi:nucleotide-binding universal stress UspA family protein
MVRIDRILCPTDFSECSQRALACALAVARGYESEVVVLHVVAGAPMLDLVPSVVPGTIRPSPLRPGDRDDLLAEMARLVDAADGGVPVECVLRESTDPKGEILAQARSRGIDLLVMGSHGRSGFDRLVLGSVTERLVREAPCPVLVVPPQAGERVPEVPFQRILCAIDFSAASIRGLAHALDLAKDASADLLLVHVMEGPPDLELETDRTWEATGVPDVRAAAEAAAIRRLQALVPPDAAAACGVHARVVDGTPHAQILRVAAEERTGLIVMGVQGRGALDLLVFGSNTQGVLRGAGCPVLTVRAS